MMPSLVQVVVARFSLCPIEVKLCVLCFPGCFARDEAINKDIILKTHSSLIVLDDCHEAFDSPQQIYISKNSFHADCFTTEQRG
jgi:hypothetical protein